MNPIVEAIVLGIVQGLTEFLPVSSSAHLIIVSWLMDGKPLPISLNIALHMGTLAAVLFYFWRDWLVIARGAWRRVAHKEKSFHADVLLPALILGTVPAALIGVLFQDQIEATFHNPATVAAPLALVGLALWWFDKTRPAPRQMESLTLKDALIIGLAQACALIPGVSRSGATILGGRFLGFNRQDAARFSFFLGTPAFAGAAVLNFHELAIGFRDPVFYVGALVAAVTGCIAIDFLLKFLRHFGFGAFAVYRVILAVVLIWGVSV